MDCEELVQGAHGCTPICPLKGDFRRAYAVQGLGVRVSGLGFRVSGLGYRVQGLGFRV